MKTIQIPFSTSVQLGQGIDPISGAGTLMTVGGVTGLPTTNPGGITNQTKTLWDLISGQSTYTKALGFEGSITGNVEAVSASFTGSYVQDLDLSSTSVTLLAVCMNLDGTWTMDYNQTGLDFSAIVDYIGQNGYEQFVNDYGTHFVAGADWGNQYCASYQYIFVDSTSATAAAAAVSAQYSGVVASGQITASFNEAITSQSGYQSESGEQQSNGAFSPVSPANMANINTNLTNFPGPTGDPIYWLCVDWRQIPAILKAYNANKGGSINWQGFYNNLPNIQETVGNLQFNLDTAQAAYPVGNTSTNLLNGYIQQLNAALATIGQYGASDIANFSSATFASQVGLLSAINNIANGQAAVQISYGADGSFSQWSNPSPYQVTAMPGQPYMVTATKNNGGNPPTYTPWGFGFSYSMNYIPNFENTATFALQVGPLPWNNQNSGMDGTASFTAPAQMTGTASVPAYSYIHVTVTVV